MTLRERILKMNDDITILLRRWSEGDEQAMEALTPLVYQELKAISERIFLSENPGHTLQPTALIGELYLKLGKVEAQFNDRYHFYALSARLMRRILVNHARSKNAAKRGAGNVMVTLHEGDLAGEQGVDTEILSLDLAMSELAAFDSRKADLLELHFFGGLTHIELAKAMDVAPSTVALDMRFAKAWLNKRLSA